MISNNFAPRHNGVSNPADEQKMLKEIGVSSMEELIDKAVPAAIRLKEPMPIADGINEYEFLNRCRSLAQKNKVYKTYIGMGYYGTSQGGASALILGGLNKHFCAILSSVPALCDHAGLLKGRSPGWPRLVDFYNGDEKTLEASRYLDGVNFASNIDSATIDLTVGFIDVTCSPSSVYAAFNAIPSEKKAIYHETQLGHQNGAQYKEAFQRLLERVRNNGR